MSFCVQNIPKSQTQQLQTQTVIDKSVWHRLSWIPARVLVTLQTAPTPVNLGYAQCLPFDARCSEETEKIQTLWETMATSTSGSDHKLINKL